VKLERERERQRIIDRRNKRKVEERYIQIQTEGRDRERK
jgi:hypothetical protein